jgi:hypothetical protein
MKFETGVMGKQPNRKPKTRLVTARKLRSAITNGSKMLANVDHRTPEMRRLRDLVAALATDQGGWDQMSEARRLVTKHNGMKNLIAELYEARIINYVVKDELPPSSLVRRYLTVCRAVNWDYSLLGLERKAKDVTPSLDEYLRERHRTIVDAEAVTDAAE